MARPIRERMPHMEMLRFVSSGTEATMSLLRLARAHTGRQRVLKFDGCYHGHADAFLVRAGSGVATLALPDSPGVPAALAALTLIAPFNDLERPREAVAAARATIWRRSSSSRSSATPASFAPDPAFLAGLRALADETGALLIFDEVMTGFRVALGGARERFGVTPDLTALGKVIGGGLPVAAYGGRREIMEPRRATGSGVSGGDAVGQSARHGGRSRDAARVDPGAARPHRAAHGRARRGVARDRRTPRRAVRRRLRSGRCGGSSVARRCPASFEEAQTADAELFRRLFHAARERGLYLAPSPFEAAFMSAAHGSPELAETLSRFDDAVRVAAAS